jgi:hypothetical protein
MRQKRSAKIFLFAGRKSYECLRIDNRPARQENDSSFSAVSAI